MIAVTRLNGSRLYVNAEKIELIEVTPDTIITFENGVKMIVRETAEQVVDAVIAFKRAAYGAQPEVIRRGGA
jgi:flagellar protein FlbD